jgi:hypothetical protein
VYLFYALCRLLDDDLRVYEYMYVCSICIGVACTFCFYAPCRLLDDDLRVYVCAYVIMYARFV